MNHRTIECITGSQDESLTDVHLKFYQGIDSQSGKFLTRTVKSLECSEIYNAVTVTYVIPEERKNPQISFI